MPEYPCPIGDCTGEVGVRQLGEFKAFGCDGPKKHTDAAIRNWMILDGEREIAENARAMSDIERRIDPVAWLHDQLHEATRVSSEPISEADYNPATLPRFATGIAGREPGALLDLRGMATLSGKASSGKSWFALGAALASAWDGWEVHYLAAEGEDVIGRRMHHATNGKKPEMFSLHSVSPGVKVGDLIENIRSWVISTRTLLVIDSISTLGSLMRYGQTEDKWEAQLKLEMFLMNVRKLTRGEVGIINISEANAAGETKGRTLDHKSDISINFQSVEDSDAKEIRVSKAWESSTGFLGRAHVDAEAPGLRMVHEGPNTDRDDAEKW